MNFKYHRLLGVKENTPLAYIGSFPSHLNAWQVCRGNILILLFKPVSRVLGNQHFRHYPRLIPYINLSEGTFLVKPIRVFTDIYDIVCLTTVSL